MAVYRQKQHQQSYYRFQFFITLKLPSSIQINLRKNESAQHGYQHAAFPLNSHFDRSKDTRSAARRQRNFRESGGH